MISIDNNKEYQNLETDSNISNEQNDTQQNINNKLDNDKNSDENRKGNKFGIISLVLFFGSIVIYAWSTYLLPDIVEKIFLVLAGCSQLVGIVVMIAGRVKYQTNGFLKVSMWIIIGWLIFEVIIVIYSIWVLMFFVDCMRSIGG